MRRGWGGGVGALVVLGALALIVVLGGPNEPRCQPVPVETGCLLAGETYPVVPDAPGCCAGLAGSAMYELSAAGTCLPLDGAGVCIDCGDGRCGPGEDVCNCPEDCDPTGCVAAGGTVPVVPDAPSCCDGLEQVAQYDVVNGSCLALPGAMVCVLCGDDHCGPGEDACSCPADCDPPAGCVAEGGSFAVVPDALPCCDGLVPVGCGAPTGAGTCAPCVGASYCARCGDGLCGPGENICRCPDDCRGGAMP